MIALALNTLGNFDLSGVQLLPFVSNEVVAYLDDTNSDIRKEAAITARYNLYLIVYILIYSLIFCESLYDNPHPD